MRINNLPSPKIKLAHTIDLESRFRTPNADRPGSRSSSSALRLPSSVSPDSSAIRSHLSSPPPPPPSPPALRPRAPTRAPTRPAPATRPRPSCSSLPSATPAPAPTPPPTLRRRVPASRAREIYQGRRAWSIGAGVHPNSSPGSRFLPIFYYLWYALRG